MSVKVSVKRSPLVLTAAEIRKYVDLPNKTRVVISGDDVSPEVAMRIIMLTDAKLYLRRVIPDVKRVEYLTAAGIQYALSEYPKNIVQETKDSLHVYPKEYIEIDDSEIDQFNRRIGITRQTDNIVALSTVQVVPKELSNQTHGWCTPSGKIRGDFITQARAIDIYRELKFISGVVEDLSLRCQIYGFEDTPVLEFVMTKSNVTAQFPKEILKLPVDNSGSWWPLTPTDTVDYRVTLEQFIAQFTINDDPTDTTNNTDK